MSRRRTVAVIMLACGLTCLPGLASADAVVGPDPGQRSWLALGDSYSSGEGIQDTPTPSQDQRPKNGEKVRDCRRADGTASNAMAWAPDAFRQVGKELGIGLMDFTACSGAITDEIPEQIEELKRPGAHAKWDLVTFSIGGNNIKFADVIKQCIGVPTSWLDVFEVGCQVDQDQIRRRIDMLGGTSAVADSEYAGTAPLAPVYDIVADHVKPGGDVVILGYPNIIEESARWPLRYQRGPVPALLRKCGPIWRKDVRLLRTSAAYLNERVKQAVHDADTRHRAKGIRFHFLDISTNPYESGDLKHQRHALCTKEPWLHGVTVDRNLYFGRSFHPNRGGYQATARTLADYLRHNVTFDDTAEPCPSVGFVPNSDDAVFDIVSHAVACDEVSAMMWEIRSDQGFGDRFGVRGFDCRLTGTNDEAMHYRLFRCERDQRWFTFAY